MQDGLFCLCHLACFCVDASHKLTDLLRPFPVWLCYRFQAFVAEGDGSDTPLTGVVEVSLQSSQVFTHIDHLLLVIHSMWRSTCSTLSIQDP